MLRRIRVEGRYVSGEFWRGKTVLITGHTGFKGSWLSLWLQSLGARVVGYSLPPPTEPSLFDVARVAQQMITVEGDVRDLERLAHAVRTHCPDMLIHMAAQSLVRRSYSDPVETYGTNVMGTVNMLEAVRQAGGIRAVVNVTSDKCYDNREWVWGYRESEPMGGHDPYSSSKGCSELVCAAYRNSYFNAGDFSRHGVALASARAGNVIGGGDWAEDRLIPDLMRAVLDGVPVTIRNPQATRPWQHVLDPLAGYLLLARRLWQDGPDFAESWNFGPGEESERSVSWIARYLTELWGEGAGWQLAGEQAGSPHEARWLKLDCSKARARLGWIPQWNLENALQRVLDWYKFYQRGADMREVCLRQIGEFMAEGCAAGRGAKGVSL